ncbi:MAG: RhuM family protein [Propionibacteriaceae bacterium]|nr:RhuM family protein [Propionibacteriaceae bacterium]
MANEIIVYRHAEGSPAVQLRAREQTVWLTLAEMAELYATSSQNIGQIVRRVLADGEVAESTTNSEFVVRSEGARQVRRELQIYNLDMILAVGYRVTTPQAVVFRQWATSVLKEYLVKGFALDDARLKGEQADYFDELLARIRDIRASEKRFYQKVRDVFAISSIDYNKDASEARTFFQTIQNKMLYAVTGQTAAELLIARADVSHPTMGLTTWAGERIRKDDAKTAKNYLSESELDSLNRLTTMFLDFADDRASRHEKTYMAEWTIQTDRFLSFNERPILAGSGTCSRDQAMKTIDALYTQFDADRRVREAEAADAAELDDLGSLPALESRSQRPKE